VPVLHVSGAEDRNIPPAVARALTHVHIDAPAELVEAIEESLAEALAGRRVPLTRRRHARAPNAG
jgi:hypothetical protein